MIVIEFKIPKATPLTSLYSQVFDLGINASLIKRVSITIPQGHKGLAYLRVRTPGFVLAPALGSSAEFIRGENETISFDINRKVFGPPYQVICEGYNLDNFLPHSFVIKIEV